MFQRTTTATFLTMAMINCTSLVAQIPDGFEPYPDKADMMVVVAYPDDESTFGGLIPVGADVLGRDNLFENIA